jgi:hypothetical protein
MLEGLQEFLVEYPQSFNRAGIAVISEVVKCVQHLAALSFKDKKNLPTSILQ